VDLSVLLSRSWPQYTVQQIAWQLPGTLIVSMLLQLQMEKGITSDSDSGANNTDHIQLRKRMVEALNNGN
jgi:hypothetical protein